MSRATRPQWTGCSRRKAGRVLRVCLAFWLIFYIVHTPIHLIREPHSEAGDFRSKAPARAAAVCIADPHQDGEDHHERHPADQHKLKVTPPTRAPVADMVAVQAVPWVETVRDCSQPQVFGFSGLSPPELSRCWQFFFRAALPVRAPSLLS